jgi:hypothetical protein
MSDTTNLDDLPIDPISGGGSGDQNVVIQQHDKVVVGREISQQQMMNEVITGIQQASVTGGLELPSRDIPLNTVHFADEATQPNYIPQKEQEDYIQNIDTEQEILARSMKNRNSRDSLEILYDEFQIPIIIGLLYFILQLPVVRNKMFSVVPSLFNKDGNPNLSGYIFNSVFFGVLYYVISKSMNYLQSI